MFRLQRSLAEHIECLLGRSGQAQGPAQLHRQFDVAAIEFRSGAEGCLGVGLEAAVDLTFGEFNQNIDVLRLFGGGLGEILHRKISEILLFGLERIDKVVIYTVHVGSAWRAVEAGLSGALRVDSLTWLHSINCFTF